jgi:hypothetical protein
MHLDLLNECTVKAPGGMAPSGSALEVILPSTIKIARLAFLFPHAPILSPDSFIHFTFQELSNGLVKADILRGDIGFPEINVENLDGEHQRMKRGNLKDFLALEWLTVQQKVAIPLSALIYNVDMKSNTKESANFWSKPIKKISFDFLCSSEASIRLRIGEPSIRTGTIDSVDIFDLISIEKAGKPDGFPTFVTENPNLSLSFCAKPFLCRLFSDLELIASVSDSRSSAGSSQFPLTKRKTYKEFRLPTLGQHHLKLTLLSCSKQLAEISIPVVRTIVSRSRIPKLGISDSALFGESFILGGSLRRTVISLKSFAKKGDSFQSVPNQPLLEALPMHPGIEWIVALKGMPKWLSSKSDQHDYYRYAPANSADFRSFVQYLVQQLLSAGVKYLEPWNEANVIHEWNDSLELLLGMQAVFYEETRGTDIVLLSPSSTTWDFQFFERLRKLGLYKFCDGIALHGYTYEPQKYQEYMHQAEGLHKGTGLPLYLTEIGFRFPTYKPCDQSIFLSLFTIEVFFSEFFAAILWFRYQNHSHETLTSYNQNSSVGYAMIGYNSSYARCMYGAFQALNYFLYRLEPIEVRRQGQSSLFIGKYPDMSIHGDQPVPTDHLLTISYCPDRYHNLAQSFLEDSRLFDCFGNPLTPLSSEYPSLMLMELGNWGR